MQAGWEDKLDFGLDLYKDIPKVPQRILTPIHSPEVLTPVDLNALEIKDAELDLPTDVCKLSHLEHERPVLFHELIPGSSASSSSIENIERSKNTILLVSTQAVYKALHSTVRGLSNRAQ